LASLLFIHGSFSGFLSASFAQRYKLSSPSQKTAQRPAWRTAAYLAAGGVVFRRLQAADVPLT
jgi:hypothetical protein